MFKLFKFILSFIVIISLISVGVYIFYKDELLNKLEPFIESKLSNLLNKSVDIASLDYMPPSAITIDKLTVFDPKNPSSEYISSKNLNIKLDLQDSINANSFILDIYFGNLKIKDLGTLWKGKLFIKTGRFFPFKNPLKLKSLKHVKIHETKGALLKMGVLGDEASESLRGEFNFSEEALSQAEFFIEHGDNLYSFTAKESSPLKYKINMNSNFINIEGTAKKEGSTLSIENLTGTFCGLNMDLKGQVTDFLTLSKIKTSLNGEVVADLTDISMLPERIKSPDKMPGITEKLASPLLRISKLLKKYNISGLLINKVKITGRGLKGDNYQIISDFSSENIEYKKMAISEPSGKLFIRKNSLDIADMTGIAYGGTLGLNLKINTNKEALPYELNFTIKNYADLDMLMEKINYQLGMPGGSFNVTLILNGEALGPDPVTGNGWLAVSDSNLELLPIFSEILKKITPSMPKASSSFRIENNEILIDDLVFTGAGIDIFSSGKVSFNGDLDLKFQTRYTAVDPEKLELSENSQVQENISFGDLIDNSQLKGDVENPKWSLKDGF